MRKEVIGDCELYLGDCTVILPQLPDFDLILTDPPYGLQRFKKGPGRFYSAGEMDWDDKPHRLIFELILQKSKNAIVWGGNNFPLPESEYFFVWDKQQTVTNFASAEIAYTNIKQPAQVFRFSIHQHNKTEKFHPTQKPTRLMEWCISFADGAKTVCDPFMGSGTTGVACARKGLHFTGIEREEKYFGISCKRIEEAYRTRPRLFEAVEKAKIKQQPLF